MNLYKLIFTKDTYLKYLRHLLFWLALYVLLLINFMLRYIDERVLSPETLREFLNWQIYNIVSLLMDIGYTYFVVYGLVPKFLQKKLYRQFVYQILAITLVAYLIRGIYHLWFFDLLRDYNSNSWVDFWYYHLIFFSAGPHIRCALFLACKMLKNSYEKMEEKLVLVKENANAELQLLKAQIHPHFLFNTLNNIYSFTLNKSPQASGLILKLSDTLKYMINDCEAELVPLEKEIKMIQDYIGLEKVRYGKRLNMEVKIKGDYQNKFIAPLLLIPFVENCFKHGTSKILDHPWIRMQIDIVENNLEFQVSNSKPSKVNPANGNNGIGLNNVKKRLDLLYPNKYSLTISDDINEFCIDLKLPLQKKEVQGVKIKKQGKITGTLAKTPVTAIQF